MFHTLESFISSECFQFLNLIVDIENQCVFYSRVREMLSIHNIGQRLFAKYVLGLSQGTVSELLSKPKSWDKLTEKGRDSYRKMHAWAYDDNAIMLLKSLIPRKGELVRPMSSSPLVLHCKYIINNPFNSLCFKLCFVKVVSSNRGLCFAWKQ